MKYKLTTIKDIFETVPSEKILECLQELGVMMVQAKGVNGALCAAVESVTGDRPLKAIEWPESVTWVDDDKHELKARYIVPGESEPMLETTTVVAV
jgi:hypothetical protein